MFDFASAISADARFLLIAGQILYDLWCKWSTLLLCLLCVSWCCPTHSGVQIPLSILDMSLYCTVINPFWRLCQLFSGISLADGPCE